MIRRMLPIACVLAWPALAAAQVPPVPPPPPAEDHSQHQVPAAPAEDHAAHQGAPASVALPPFIPPVTDADRAVAFPDVHDTMAHDDNAFNSFVLFDQLEWQSGGGDTVLGWDTKGWVGRDRDRLWFRTEGERDGGRLAHAEAQVFYGRAIGRWWDALAGVRQDARPGAAQSWVGVGLQGLAPYWFEVEATAYVSTAGRTHLRLESEYELLVTNRLVLQPFVEANFYGRADPSRGRGAGLSAVEGGMRLRYEFRREFAPYVGVTWQRRLFGAADDVREKGQRAGSVRFAIGLRLWL